MLAAVIVVAMAIHLQLGQPATLQCLPYPLTTSHLLSVELSAIESATIDLKA
ncbi:unnamed protein product, partial [Ceratitis capitata]